MKKCPSSIRCWDSNSPPLEHKSHPITTRPGLSIPLTLFLFLYFFLFDLSFSLSHLINISFWFFRLALIFLMPIHTLINFTDSNLVLWFITCFLINIFELNLKIIYFRYSRNTWWNILIKNLQLKNCCILTLSQHMHCNLSTHIQYCRSSFLTNKPTYITQHTCLSHYMPIRLIYLFKCASRIRTKCDYFRAQMKICR